jgi:osmotically-inducible protein OsmY
MKKHLCITAAWVALAAITASAQTSSSSQNTSGTSQGTGSQGNSQGNVPTSQSELQRRLQNQRQPSQGFAGQTNAVSNGTSNRGGQGKFQDEAGSETDRRLLGSVQEKVRTEVRGLNTTGGGAGAPGVHFRIQNGVVTIVGVVQSIEIKQQIEECVRRVPGVVRVVNEIEFGRTQGGGGDSDQVLVTRVRERVLTEIRVSGIDFQCHGGVVTVIGSVPQPEMKQRLIALVREVPGVVNVTDQVTVGAEVKGQTRLNQPEQTRGGQPQQTSQGETERDRAVSAGIETSKTNLPPTGRENLPPGLEKKEQLPPGLQNREELPSGLSKRTNGATQPRP